MMAAPNVDTRVRASDLWHEGPRKRSKVWGIGDVLVLPGANRVCRWVIRNVTSAGVVELEQTNSGTRVWWTTTIDRLPAKEMAR